MPDLWKVDGTCPHYAQGRGVPRIAYLSMSRMRRRVDSRATPIATISNHLGEYVAAKLSRLTDAYANDACRRLERGTTAARRAVCLVRESF